MSRINHVQIPSFGAPGLATVLEKSGLIFLQKVIVVEARMGFRKASPEGAKPMGERNGFVRKCGLEWTLLELFELRASQINGCAHCIDMQTEELRAVRESEQRLHLLNAWRESPFYSDRERAAPASTEAITLITVGHVPDDIFREARAQFNEQERANLTLAIIAINGSNRLNIAFRTAPGSHRIAALHATNKDAGARL